jgi:hypothetical protein
MVFYKNNFLRPYSIGDNIKISPADRQPCPVCGHPTGDCVGESTAEPDHIIGFGVEEPNPDAQQFVVKEDVYVERQLTPTTKTRVLVAVAGKVISVTQAKNLGLI